MSTTTKPEPEEPEESEKPPSENVEDDENYIQRQLTKQILELHTELRRALPESQDYVDWGHMDDVQARRSYHRALKEYLIELEPLYTITFDEIGKKYEEVSLGNFTIPPPGDMSNADPKTNEIVGLSSILNVQPGLVAEFEQTTTSLGRQRTVTREVDGALSWEVLERAFRLANMFISEIGIAIEKDETQHRAEVDKEVLEEIEEWRKQTI